MTPDPTLAPSLPTAETATKRVVSEWRRILNDEHAYDLIYHTTPELRDSLTELCRCERIEQPATPSCLRALADCVEALKTARDYTAFVGGSRQNLQHFNAMEIMVENALEQAARITGAGNGGGEITKPPDGYGPNAPGNSVDCRP